MAMTEAPGWAAPPGTNPLGPDEVPPGPALDHGPTAAAVGRHRNRAVAWGGVGAIILAVSSAGLARSGWESGLWLRVGGIGLGLLLGGGVLVGRWLRLRGTLRRHPWVLRRAHHVVAGVGKYRRGVVLLEAEGGHAEVVCEVSEMQGRRRVLAREDGPLELWVAGDPTSRAAAAPPGAPDVVPLREPWTAWGRRRLRRQFEGA
jgi:hypothetical protein